MLRRADQARRFRIPTLDYASPKMVWILRRQLSSKANTYYERSVSRCQRSKFVVNGGAFVAVY